MATLTLGLDRSTLRTSPHISRSDVCAERSPPYWPGSAWPHAALFATSGSAQSHGYTDSPISRQQLCGIGTVKHCGQIQWEPPSVEGPKGFPTRGPADGHICSGGIGRFSELDDPRGGAW